MHPPDGTVIGWDIGGAHVKACRLARGQVVDVAQWACPLWQGIGHLEQVLSAARTRWPDLTEVQHAVTMTGEMVDLFADRRDGVRRIAAVLLAHIDPGRPVQFFAGDAGWCDAAGLANHWAAVASANWLATARHAALGVHTAAHGDGVLVDIGSTTTDLIAFRRGAVVTRSRSDAERLATGELVYHGVVRTPLCAVAPRIDWRGRPLNVMNEFFATTADIYRLTGQLDPSHDQHPPADNAAKDATSTRRRLARMIGLDEHEGTPAEWLAMAKAWRAAQVEVIAGELRRVIALHALADDLVIVSAGCGDFLVAAVVAAAFGEKAATPVVRYADAVARVGAAAPDGTAAWAQVCAPCVAVAALSSAEQR
jgi:(4-(4-[2-(gamma-L-glutamylamino)ethyl]phenoxymethyl)furan-2-yl)methanamine synthase